MLNVYYVIIKGVLSGWSVIMVIYCVGNDIWMIYIFFSCDYRWKYRKGKILIEGVEKVGDIF